MTLIITYQMDNQVYPIDIHAVFVWQNPVRTRVLVHWEGYDQFEWIDISQVTYPERLTEEGGILNPIIIED